LNQLHKSSSGAYSIVNMKKYHWTLKLARVQEYLVSTARIHNVPSQMA